MSDPAPADLTGVYRRYLASLVLFHLAAADAVGLGGSDYQADSILDLDGPMSSGELAARLGLSLGATTRLIDRLVATGSVRRVPDPDDRRRVIVEHTGTLPPGLADILDGVREPIGAVIAEMTEAELAALRRYFAGAGAAYAEALARLRSPDD